MCVFTHEQSVPFMVQVYCVRTLFEIQYALDDLNENGTTQITTCKTSLLAGRPTDRWIS